MCKEMPLDPSILKKSMKKLIKIMALLFVAVAAAYAQPKHVNQDDHKLALEGYDPVAYFTEKKAIKGKSSLVAEHEGTKYQFSSEANKNLFLKSPASYKPQYGGWCAYAMGSYAEKVEVDPETFKIVDGKLYLFYNKLFNNTLDTWNKDEAQLKANADKNWTKLITP